MSSGNSEKISEFVDPSAVAEFEKFIDLLVAGQTKMADLGKEALEFNKTISNASGYKEFMAVAKASEDSMKKLNDQIKETAKLEKQAYDAEARAIELSKKKVVAEEQKRAATEKANQQKAKSTAEENKATIQAEKANQEKAKAAKLEEQVAREKIKTAEATDRRTKAEEKQTQATIAAAKAEADRAKRIAELDKNSDRANKSLKESSEQGSDFVVQNEKDIARAIEASQAAAVTRSKEVKKASETVNEATKEEKDLLETYGISLDALIQRSIALKIQQKELSQEFKDNKDNYSTSELVELDKAQKQVTEALRQNEVQVKRVVRANLEEVGSIDRLENELLALRGAYKKLSDEEKANANVGGVLKAKIVELDKSFKDQKKSIGENTVEVGNYKLALEGLPAPMRSVLDLLGRIAQQDGAVTMAALVKGAKAVGAAFIALATTPIGATIIALGSLYALFQANKDAVISFDSGMKDISKTTGIAGKDLDNLSTEIIRLSTRLKVVSAEGLTQYAAIAGQLGTKGVEDILGFTETLAKLETASDISGENGGKELARFLELTDGGVQNVADFGDEIVNLGNNFAASEREILTNAEAIAQNTGMYDLGRRNALAFATATKAVGLEAEVVGSTFQRTLGVIGEAIRTGDGLREVLQVVRMTEEQLAARFKTDAAGVFKEYINGLNGIKRANGDVVEAMQRTGVVQTRDQRVIGTLATKGYPTLALAIDTVADSYRAMTDEFLNGSEKLENQQKRLGIAWDNFVLSIENGTGVLGNFVRGAVGVMASLVEAITPNKNAFDSVTDAMLQQRAESERQEKKVGDLIAKYKEFTAQVLSTNTGQEELRKTINDLASILPEAVTEWDRYGNALGINLQRVEDLSAAHRQLLLDMNASAIAGLNKDYEASERRAEKMTKELNNLAKVSDSAFIFTTREETAKTYREEIAKLTKQSLQAAQALQSIGAATSQDQRNLLSRYGLDQAGEAMRQFDRLLKAGEIDSKGNKIDMSVDFGESDDDIKKREAAQRKAEAAANKAQRERERKLREEVRLYRDTENRKIELRSLTIQYEQNAVDEMASYSQSVAFDENNSLEDRINNLADFNTYRQKSIDNQIALERQSIEKSKVEAEALRMEGKTEEYDTLKEITEKREGEIGNMRLRLEAELQRKITNEARQMMEERYGVETDLLLNQVEDRTNELLRIESGRFSRGEINQREYSQRVREIEQQSTTDFINTQIDQLQAIIDVARDKKIGTSKYEKEIADLRRQLAKSTADYEIEQQDRVTEQIKDAAEQRKEINKSIASASIELFNTLFERQIANADFEIKQLNEEKDRELKQLDQTVLNTEEKNKRKFAIEQRFAEQEKVLQKQRQDAEIKQAKFQKASAVLNIATSTAMGIARAFADFPFFIAAPIATSIGALGAIQLATALAQPLPRYYTGTDSSIGGLAHVGERGKEIVVEPDGNVWMTPSTDTVMNLKKGSQIFNNTETKAILANKNTGYDSKEMMNILHQNRRDSQAIVEAIKNQNIMTTHITKGGFRVQNEKVSKRNSYLSNKGIRL